MVYSRYNIPISASKEKGKRYYQKIYEATIFGKV